MHRLSGTGPYLHFQESELSQRLFSSFLVSPAAVASSPLSSASFLSGLHSWGLAPGSLLALSFISETVQSQWSSLITKWGCQGKNANWKLLSLEVLERLDINTLLLSIMPLAQNRLRGGQKMKCGPRHKKLIQETYQFLSKWQIFGL